MSTPAPRVSRILHISDLHFGRQFQGSKWLQLKNSAKSIKPDLVIVTGDLVNTPWFWMLKRARDQLATLSQELAPTGREAESCEVWAIPGNHDTRITGLIPARWLLPIAAVGFLVALGFWSLGTMAPALPMWAYVCVMGVAAVFLAVGAISLILRCLVRTDLAAALGTELFLTEARRSKVIPVGIVPFDSASEGVSWARGRISDDSFAKFRSGIARAEQGAKSGENLVWIAAVHHHPLPLPYDDNAEHMMVMDNAGAFLSELSKAGIRLVLHGHKHHQHFARIVVDPVQSEPAELAVLSAGTPTERRNAGAFWHGFNVIDVDADGRVHIEMREGPPGGGAFVSNGYFDLAPVEEQDRRRHALDCASIGAACKRMLCVVDIEPYGDAHFVREFRGVSTSRDSLTELPGPYLARARSGLVEAFTARQLCDHGPSVTLAISGDDSRERMEARITFGGSGLRKDEPPIDFATEFYANNAFALNRWQFECMYPTATERRETMRFRTPLDIAVRELLIHVRFPEDGPLPRRIDVKQQAGTGANEHWSVLAPTALVRIESQGVIQVRIPFPLPGATFELNWELRDNVYGDANSSRETDIARALVLREKFAQLTGRDIPEDLGAQL